MVAWWLLIVAFLVGMAVGILVLCIVSANVRITEYDYPFHKAEVIKDRNEY